MSNPQGMPVAIVDKLNRELVRIVRLQDTRDKLAADGMLPVGGTPAQFAALLKSEDEKWRRVVQDRGLAAK